MESTFRDRRPHHEFPLTDEQITELTDYVIQRAQPLDRDLLPYGDPADKDVLVFGCGYGNDALWAARHGARSILALDLSPGLSAVPFERALDQEELDFTDFEFRVENVHDTALTGDTFDLIVSNGVFEHVLDLKGVLTAFRSLLKPGGRIAIFADGLWYSAIGGHIHKGPWEHLWRTPAELKGDLSKRGWAVYRDQLNRMTAVDFVEAVRSVGLFVLQMNFKSDQYLPQLPGLLPKIQATNQVSPTDLSIVSIGCELCFPENL